MDSEIGIDYDIDFHDTGHLNSVGMGIITEDVGRLLDRDELQAQRWNQAYNNYKQYMFSRITGFTNVKSYLMSINDAELFSEIQVREDILKDVQIAKLIDRLREEGNQITVTEEKTENIIGGGQNAQVEYDIYCEVHRRDDLETVIHTAGFHYEPAFEKN